MRALIVEDDSGIALLVTALLGQEGFAVDATDNANEGLTLAVVHDYDVLILDLGLPDRNGLTVVQALRRRGNPTPVLILTGDAKSETTVLALDAGADDYLTKPLVPDEFRARIRALVRRGGAKRTEEIQFGNLNLNRLTRELRIECKEVQLTARELALMEQLMLHPNEVITRSQLLEKVWDMNFDPGSNVVDVTITRIRKKLEACDANATIVAKRGMGFCLKLKES